MNYKFEKPIPGKIEIGKSCSNHLKRNVKFIVDEPVLKRKLIFKAAVKTL